MAITTKLGNFKFSPEGISLLKKISVYMSILILIYGFTQSFIQYRMLIFFAIFLTTIGGIWFISKKHSPTPLKPFLFLWLAAYSISLILSIDPRRSISQMFFMLAGLLLFLLSYDLIHRGWKIQWFISGFVIMGTFILVISLRDVISWYLNWITVNPGQWIPYINFRPGNANLIAPYMYLAFHMALTLLFKEKKNITKVLLAIILFLTMLELYLTSSRGGWLGMFFGLIVWGIFFFTTQKMFLKYWFQKIVKNKWLFSASIILVLVVVSFGGNLLYNKAIHPTHGSILTSRSGLWGPAITAFKQNPFFGQGQFTYGTAFLLENSAPPNTVYVHPHGMYHNLLGEMGIVGFIAAVTFSIAYSRKFKINFNQSKEKIYMVGILAYCVSFFIHSIFDSFNLEVSLFWPMTILTGVAIAQPSSMPKMPSSGRPWWVLILIGSSWFGIWTITPHYQGVAFANQNQWGSAYEKFQTAVKRDPLNAITHQQLSLIAAVLADKGDANKLDEAITELKKTIQLEPAFALNHANLAALHISNNDLVNASEAAKRAVELAPGTPLYSLNLGFILEQNGELENAQVAYQQTLSLNPEWSTSDFWHETDLRDSFINNWMKDNPAPGPISFEEAYQTWQNNQQVNWAFNQLASAQIHQGDLEGAKKTLQNSELAYVNSPQDRIETDWLWVKYYEEIGDYKLAEESREQIITQYNHYGIYGPGTFGVLYYAPNMFRMSAMAMEIVPQMVDVPIPAIWQE
ncbi:MAG: O-antigen ligase family protein [Anaerolineaceae bacterium]|nr:O-antigen ligase family protein [Anaerolineaceae bacterium]